MSFDPELHRDAIYRYAATLLGDVATADDITNAVMTKAAALESAPDSPRAWLYTAARNRCLNHLRSLSRRPETQRLATGHDVAASLAGPLTRMVQDEQSELLQARIESLSPGERDVIQLRYAEQLSRAEVATVLDIPESTVKSRLAAALTRLRQA